MLTHYFILILNFSFLIFLLVIIIYRLINYRKKIDLYFLVYDKHNLFLVLIVLVLIWNQFYLVSFYSETAWKSDFSRTLNHLTGKNVEIVPIGEKGYIIDSTSDSQTAFDNAYSNILIKTIKTQKRDLFQAAVYCFVSNDFNGDSVKILVKGAVKGSNESFFRLYDLENDSTCSLQNLINNGNFESGTTNWIPWADSTTHTIVETPFGKGIRVSRGNGDGGYWSLKYVGRPIVYYIGHRYQIKFKFKVQKGVGIPFKIGWWGDNPNDGFTLPLEIIKLNDGWNEAIGFHKFMETSYDLPTFLNSLQDYSIIDITDVRMTDLDGNDSIPYFIDQLSVKGTWQKLTINVYCDPGKISFYLSILKKSTHDLKSLKGQVIFAKPEYRLIRDNHNSSIINK
jgi:hypothetical protein